MAETGNEHDLLNARLSHHMGVLSRCAATSEKYGALLLATPPGSRYPYIYPRDASCAAQFLRRVATSRNGYDSAPQAWDLLQSLAHFMRDAAAGRGFWGQRYSVEGLDKSIYKQEDNVAHGIAILCNYLLAARKLRKDVGDLESFLTCINSALHYGLENFYQKELNLFRSTTSIHESALEEGYTCWVNFSFLYAFSLAHEVAHAMDDKRIISPSHKSFRQHFLYTVGQLFLSGERYVRRIDLEGRIDMRPDVTLISPFYYGFWHDRREIENSVRYLERQLWDPELGMIMRYLPFDRDFGTHVHAGNGPWLQYTAMLAQYHYWRGDADHGDELIERIDRFTNEQGEIPEHVSTCRRFDAFIASEWRTGVDFAREFHKPILLETVDFDRILEEANNMARSYAETATRCEFVDRDEIGLEEGYVRFATPLAWSHVEYARALLMKARDWWKM